MKVLRGCCDWYLLGFDEVEDCMCGLERFGLMREEEEKGKTYEDMRTWNLLVPIRYKLFGSFSKWSGYDSLKL